MATRNRKKRSVRNNKKKKPSGNSVLRVLALTGLLLFFSLSVCAVGYVIFFRTVFAQEILPALKDSIVFEEPDPPVHTEELKPEDPPITPPPVLPKVAIIIDDMGYHKALGEQLLELPFPITYSFLPFAPFTRQQQETAYLTGKTVFLHLPLEPKSRSLDPGPGALFVSDSLETQKEKFEKCLAEVPYAVGVNNHMGSLYTEDKEAMNAVLKEIELRALSFLDSYTTSDSVGLSLAQSYKISSARRHVFLDNELDEGQICTQLDKLVIMAEKRGRSIGIAHPHRETVDAIKACGGKYMQRVQYVSVVEVMN